MDIRVFSSKLLIPLTFLLVLTGSSGLFGQTVSGDLVGSISDASGSAVPSATVEAANIATGVKNTAQTNANGEYRIPNLPTGTYKITANAPGFAASSENGVKVAVGTSVTANLTMQVGSVASSVEVSEAATVIDTTTATIQNQFEAKLAQDLPTASIGLGVLNLSLLGSGVASSGGVGAGTGPSVGGQRPRNNNFQVEGVDNNSKSVTGPLIFIPNDAVENFTLLQNQFAPEFGHSSGGQFNTLVKSGGNTFHGSIYDYLQNRKLNAVDQVSRNQGIFSNPRYDSNRLGATIGGPILRNRLFFFGNFEYNPVGQAAQPGAAIEVPTVAGLSTIAGLPGISQTNLSILQKYAPGVATQNASDTVSIAGKNIPIGIFPVVAPNFQNNYASVVSLDYTLSEKDQLRGRYIWNKQSGIDTAAELPVFYLPLPTTYYLGSLIEYHNFTPNLTNELRLGYNRYNNTTPAGNFKFPGLDSFPNLTFDELNLQIGPDPNAPQYTIQNHYQATDNVTWIKGRHTVKFGFEGHKAISPQTFTQRARGDYDYSTLEGYLLDQTPDSLAERSLGNVVFYGDQVALYSYINDTFRLRPNFTINLGLRHEFTSVPYGERAQKLNAISSVPGLIDFREPKPQHKNFAPRVGIAYSPGNSGNTSIRAGFGIAYDVLYDNIGILSLPPQLSTTVDAAGIDNFLAKGGIAPNSSAGQTCASAADCRSQTSSYIPDQKLPYSINWNFGVQHTFAKDYTFEARYVGTRGVHLNVQDRLNRRTVVTATHSLPTFLSAPSQATLDALPLTLSGLKKEGSFVPAYANAGFKGSNIVGFAPIGNSTYHGLATQLNRRFSNGLQFIGAYTWSHAIDDSTADFFTTVLSPRRVQDFQNLRPEKASSALDHRQRLSFTAVYDVPWFKNSNWFVKNLIGNWEVAPIYIVETPELATVQSAQDANLNGDTAGDRSIINPGGVAGTGSGVTALKNTAGATVGYLATNPNARYIRAGQGAYANGGRNTLPTRRINNWDATLIKRFSYRERVKLEFQAQFLNAFNHAQFTPGILNQINSIGHTDTGSKNYLTPGKAAFNNPEVTFSSNPRTIQLAAKLVF